MVIMPGTAITIGFDDSDNPVHLNVGEVDPLCSEKKYCRDKDLFNALTRAYDVVGAIGTGIRFDVNRYDVFNDTRGFNVTCAYDYVPHGNASWTVVACDSENGFAEALDFVEEELDCQPYESTWCAASIWNEEEDSIPSDTAFTSRTMPSKFDVTIFESDEFVAIDATDSFEAGTLRIDGVRLVLAEGETIQIGGVEPLCSDARCDEDDLLGNLTDYYDAIPLGSPTQLDMNSLAVVNATRGFNVTCARGCTSRKDDDYKIVQCDSADSYSSFDPVAELSCAPINSTFCPASLWGNMSEGNWSAKGSWQDGRVPSEYDTVVLDDEAVVKVTGKSIAAELEIGAVGEIVITDDDDAEIVIGDPDDEAAGLIDKSLCGSNLCFFDDLAVPDGYKVTAIGSRIVVDIADTQFVPVANLPPAHR